MELLERGDERAALTAAFAASYEEGRVVVVAGEAGIGKTALVTSVCAELERRVLWGACDPLVTPRPLGPFRDIARHAGGSIAEAVEGAAREDVLAAALGELAGEARSVLVVEDLHWADDATLDLVALLGRRLARERGCLVLTCRSEAVSERPEVRRVLGALPRERVVRIEPAPLTEGAVATLARAAGRDPLDLHALSGGNPFFVTEVLAAPPRAAVPASVRDAVAARIAALGEESRRVIELVAVVPGPTELWLLADTVRAAAAAIDACITSGILNLAGGAVAFRHDLARRGVEYELTPVRRRELHRLVLHALEAAGGANPARLAHHARLGGDAGEITRLAPIAARAASVAGGHRQALEQWEAALAATGGSAAPETAEALEGVAVEAYLCGRPERALEARRALLALHEADGDDLAVGEDLRWLSRILWWSGRGAEAAEVGGRSIAVLEAHPESRELAMALSGQSQLAMLSDRHAEAVALGTRAIRIARRIDDRETVAHALTNVGTTLLGGPEHERGRELLEEAFGLAVAAAHDDHAARALVNLATSSLMRRRDDPRNIADLDRALEFARERDLVGYMQYLLGVRSNVRVLLGAWPAAEADARSSLELGEQWGVSLCPALLALGRLQARRGDAEAGATLEEAWRRAVATQELQRLAPAAAARAEHAWLGGDRAATAAAAGSAYALAIECEDAWGRGELAFWLWRAGELERPPDGAAEPYARSIAGDWSGAAAAWTALRSPYEAADALSEADDESARVDALAVFDGFGAARSASHLRRRLRGAGVRRIPRGPRPSSRAGLAGLTPRQTEVLELMAGGATNAQIAQRLVIAPKTVDHHVSAVLAKLGVTSRRDVAAAVERLGPQ